ncbi:MAG: hypothetical protein ACK4UJ_11575 [Leptonema sp. (in: bacteria)]
MLILRPLFRIVIHYLDDQNPFKRHGDLFIDFPNLDTLITFEIDSYYLEILKKKYDYVYLLMQDINILGNSKEIPLYSNITEIYNKHHGCDILNIPLKRKVDHRKEYLRKEGILPNEKGKIEQFMISNINGIVLYKNDQLILIDKE